MADIKINNKSLTDIIDDDAKSQIVSSKSDNNTLTFTNREGTETKLTINGGLSDVITASNAGHRKNESVSINSGTGTTTMSFKVPYFTVDKQGRITSSATRTVSITRPAYTNYNNYNNYSDYYNYGNYSSYSDYSRYGSND